MTRHKGVQHRFAHQTGQTPTFNPLASTGPMFEAAAQATASLCEGVTEIGKELAEFTARRVREDLTFPARLVKCRSPQDVQQAYVDFWTTAFTQYQNEFGRLAKMNQAFGHAAATKFGQAVEEVSVIRIAA